jgi:hypothetical protein
VRIQIWTALSTYLLVAILKKTLKLKPSLHEILQVIRDLRSAVKGRPKITPVK